MADTNTSPPPIPHHTLTIKDLIDEMTRLVQQGEFSQAEAIGHSAPCDLAIPKSHLPKGRIISQGSQAIVYESLMPINTTNATQNHSTNEYTDNADHDNKQSSILVAVKKVCVREPQDLIRFRREVFFLATLQHPHIVTLLGARLLPPDYMMVLTLEASTLGQELHSKGWRPGWAGALNVCKQIASAVAHLHSHGIIHRDIKPANVLLSSDHCIAKLTDFGIAEYADDILQHNNSNMLMRNKPTGGFHKGLMLGTLEYMAPEVLLKHPHSMASDVFALAVVMNEIAAGIVPYSDCTRDNPLAHTILEMGYGRQELAVAVAAEGLRPTLDAHTNSHTGNTAPVGIHGAIQKLLRSCWSASPEQRPTAAHVAGVLQDLSKLVPYSPEQSAAIQPHDRTPMRYQQSSGEMLHLVESKNDARFLFGDGSTKQCSVLDNPPGWLAFLLHSAPFTTTPSITTTNMRAGSFASPGPRGEDRMEDRCLIARNACCVPGCLITGVFDGHGGYQAAEYLASHLEIHIEHRWTAQDCEGPGKLLRDALLDADRAFCDREEVIWTERVSQGLENASSMHLRKYPGSTAVVAMMIGHSLTLANIGDSRAVVCSEGNAVQVTRDHTLALKEERRRILSHGAHIIPPNDTNAAAAAADSTDNGYDGNDNNDVSKITDWHSCRIRPSGLSVTRSIGDANVKRYGVTAEAEVHQLTLDFNKDSFLILASDGVWDVVDPQEAVDIVHDTVKQPAMCAQRIVLEALTRGSKDNVTAVVVIFDEYYNGEDGGGAFTAEKIYDGSARRTSRGGGMAATSRVAARLVEDEIMDTY